MVSQVVLRHGPGVERATTAAAEAYARLLARRPPRYRNGSLRRYAAVKMRT